MNDIGDLAQKSLYELIGINWEHAEELPKALAVLTTLIKNAQIEAITECSDIASREAGKVTMGDTGYLRGYMYGSMASALAIGRFKIDFIKRFK